MKKFIMGIDGGGTKSHLALFDENGVCAGVSACGALNHEGLEGSFGELEEILSKLIPDALEKAGAGFGSGAGADECGVGVAGAGSVAYAVLGIAGVDTAAQHSIISDIITRIGIKRFYLCNDAYLGVAAGCPDCVGICAINGTGTTVAAIDHSGKSIQVGGVGALSDDRGGGGWYGRQVLGVVYNSLFKGAAPTLLKDMLFERLGVTRKDEYLDALTESLANGKIDYQVFNRLAFKAAGAGDAVAIDIMDRSAEHYAGSISYIANEMDFPADKTLYVTFAGSVFVKEKVTVLPELIKTRVRALLGSRKTEYYTLDTPPVAGAVLWAARKAGFDVDMPAVKSALAEKDL
jgi:N-acetylglucosamine kinase-like BadF-type ATPase